MTADRSPAKTFRDLIVWRKAHEFVLAVYRLTDTFPKRETYGLALQMRRAAVSIPANIAEGFKRRGKVDKVRFMNMAEGSVEESRYYLMLSQDLGYGETGKLMDTLEEVSRMLNAYAKGIQNSDSQADSRLLAPDSSNPASAGFQGRSPWLRLAAASLRIALTH